MTLPNFANFAKATVSIGYDSSATTIVLATGEGAVFPTGDFYFGWWNSTDYSDPTDDPTKEISYCPAGGRTGDTFTGISRGQRGTTAQNHNTSGKVYKILISINKEDMDDIKSWIDAEGVPAESPNGVLTTFTFDNNITSGSVTLSVNKVLQYEGATEDFTVSGATIIFAKAPPTGAKIFMHRYKKS